VYYELDLGLNHVTRKWSEKVDRTSNYLIALPGGVDGPSGVLVCSENRISWVHEGYPSLSVPIPKRAKELEQNQNGEEATKEGILIVNSVVHKLKKTFFILAQTEQGDLFKITVEYDTQNVDGTGASGVQNLKIKYFDTVPVAHSLSILKTGFLFIASEFGNHPFYQIENLGDDEENQPEYQSVDFSQDTFDSQVFVPFQPRPLRNLSAVDEIQSFAPFTDATFLTPKNDDIPILYALSGRGANSSIKVFQLGLEVSEIAISELPGTPTAIWTVKLSVTDEYHSYIVVSFVNATLVLSIGETVEEVTDSGILGSVPTLLLNQIGNDALVQVYKSGIRHISADKRIREWKAPAGKTIVKAASNRRQVVIALSSAELIYFELDSAGNLNEFQERREMGAPVASLTLGPIPEGRLRSRYMAAGLTDNTVRLLALDPESCLQSLGMQALNSIPESVCLTYITEKSTGKIPSIPNLYLYVGLQSGVLIRSSMDEVTGALTDTRMKFLGTKPVRLFPIRIGDTEIYNSMLALSSKSWLAYTWQARNRLLPMTYDGLEFAADFASEPCPQGIVAIAGNTLRILSVDKLSSVFQQSSIPLTYTPRRFAVHPDTQQFLVIESEYGALCPSEKQQIEEDSMDMDEQSLDPGQFGYPKANGQGKWASLIRLLNPFTGENLTLFQLNENEAAFSVCVCRFNSDPSSVYAVVGTAKDLVMTPRSFSAAYLRVYRFSEEGTDLELIHSTPVEEVPYTLCPFQGRLLVSVGRVLRLYDLGKKKLLRKCENKVAFHQDHNLNRAFLVDYLILRHKEVVSWYRIVKIPSTFYNTNKETISWSYLRMTPCLDMLLVLPW
jgi:splicing factor 3B subunit 3